MRYFYRMNDFWIYFIAIVGSIIAGAINTLAGNGSAITLTILTELLGLPGNLANGTNRVGIVAQTAASNWSFYKNGMIDLSRSKLIVIATIIGAIIGIFVANQVSNEQFRQVFRFLLVIMFFIILFNPKRWLIETDVQKELSPWFTIPVFLALGFYGGFIQMGMGVFFLAATVLGAKINIIESNVLKGLIVFGYTIIAVIIFALNGLVDWRIGLIMGIGQMAGGYLMAEFAFRYESAKIWAHRLLVAVVLLAIIKLFDIHLHVIELFRTLAYVFQKLIDHYGSITNWP